MVSFYHPFFSREYNAMDRAWIIFGILISLCCVTGVMMFFDPAENSHGVVHPQYSSMQIGGDTERHNGSILFLGWLFGTLQILFFVSLLTFGIHRDRLRPAVFIQGGLSFLFVFTMIIIIYQLSLGDAPPQITGGLPLPSALMVYGLAGTPLIFTVLYIMKFDTWILTPEDLLKFQSIMDRKKPTGRYND